MQWGVALLILVVVAAVASAEGEIWEEDEHEVLIRSERGTRNRGKYIQTNIQQTKIVGGLGLRQYSYI